MNAGGGGNAGAAGERLFFGLAVPEEIAPRLEEVQARFRPVLDRAAWVPPRNFHVTVRFLGNAAPAARERVIEAVAGTLQGLALGELSLRGVGIFPSWCQPRVLWAGCAGPIPSLTELHRRVEAGLASAGWPADRDRFHPHVTLARIRRWVGAASALTSLGERFMGTDFGSWRVADLVLYRSELRPDGALYRVVRRFPL